MTACGQSSNAVAEPGSALLATSPAGTLVPTGDHPEGIAFDPVTGVLAVGVRDPDAVLFLDRDGHLLRRVPVSAAPRHLTFAAPGGPLLVPAERSGELVVVAVPSGAEVARVRVGRQPHDATQADGRYFVTNEFSNSISVVERSAVIANLRSPSQPGGVATASGSICVVGVRSHTLEVIEAASLRPIGTAPAGAGPTHVVADAGTCYVVDTTGNAVLAFDVSPSFRLVFTSTVPGKPYGIAIDVERKRLWVTETATNSLAELSLSASIARLVATFPSVLQPNSVAVDPSNGRVFVAGDGDGMIQIIDPPA
jgi:DNA-binding beta-propeller fold protein YncE